MHNLTNVWTEQFADGLWRVFAISPTWRNVNGSSIVGGSYTKQRADEIVAALTSGYAPITGQTIPENSYNNEQDVTICLICHAVEPDIDGHNNEWCPC